MYHLILVKKNYICANVKKKREFSLPLFDICMTPSIVWVKPPTLKVKLSRFFEWSGRWKGFARFWTFLRLVHTSLQALKASSVEVQASEDDPAEQQDASLAGGPQDLLQKLKALQEKNPWWMLFAAFFKTARFASWGGWSLTARAFQTWGVSRQGQLLPNCNWKHLLFSPNEDVWRVLLYSISKLCLPQGS